MTSSTSQLLIRKRLLDAARGLSKTSATTLSTSESSSTSACRPLRCFPLQSRHVEEAFAAPTPEKFHSLLCQKIRNAKQRVLLASLYVGPAASPKAAPKEQELLDALQVAANNNVQVDLLLDKNRALRPVPLSGETNAKTTSSAKAVWNVLSSKNSNDSTSNSNNNLFLFSVLPPSLQYFLPNPYNELAGVFHLKVYIVDDSLILSGANLSEEYFVDRHDRYLHFTEGGAGMVDFYGDLLKALSDHSEVYTGDDVRIQCRKPSTRTEFLEALNQIMTTEEENAQDLFHDDKDKIVAVAVPTFQAPEAFFSASNTQRCFLKDTEVTEAMLQAALKEDPSSAVKLSSAYLNPTDAFLRVLAGFKTIEFLTAGRISHGFAPKKKAGNKGKDWIPTVFETLSRDACQHLKDAKLLYYERPGWTFHAKGLWLESNSNLVAAICGSGNYGARSENLDMESNCVLIVPPGSSMEILLQGEWSALVEYTQPLEITVSEESKIASAEKPTSLSWPLQVLLPVLKKYF